MKINKSVVKYIIIMLFLGIGAEVSAQYDGTGSNDNTRRSIWDKEPEPQTTTSPYASSLQQPLGTGQLQQATTLGGPAGTGLQGGASGPDASSIPIDGGLSLLLAAGAGYGVRRIRQARRTKKTNQ